MCLTEKNLWQTNKMLQRRNCDVSNTQVSFFCLTDQFFRRSLQNRPGNKTTPKEEPLAITGARYLQAECRSCCPSNSVKALKRCQ